MYRHFGDSGSATRKRAGRSEWSATKRDGGSAVVDPLGRAILLGERGDGFVEIGPGRGGGGEVERGREAGGKRVVKSFVVEVARERGAMKRALKEEAALGAFLRGAGEFHAGGGMHDVVEFGAGEADGGALGGGACGGVFVGVVRGRWFAGELHEGVVAELAQGGGESFMHEAVALDGAEIGDGRLAGDDERVGAIITMIDDAAAGGATAEFTVEIDGQVIAHPGDFLAEAEGDGGARPAVGAEAGVGGGGVVLEEEEIGRHVGGGGIGARGEEVERHGAEGVRRRRRNF